MLKPEIEDLLNQQFVKEVYSAHLYLSMSAWLSEKSLNGYSHWFYVQYKEEMDHALIIHNYILNAGGSVKIGTVDAPPSDFESLKAILDKAYEHEQYVTSLIYNIAKTARELDDLKTVQFMDWFIKEQVEEEDNASDNIGRYALLGKDSMGLYTLDQEVGARTYTQTAYLAQMEGTATA